MPTASPALFPWEAVYSVNIQVLDTQHKNLVNTLNELHGAMVEGSGKEKLGQILSNLIKYTQQHFATEEWLMQAHGYPDFQAHKSQHESLTGTVMEFLRRF